MTSQNEYETQIHGFRFQSSMSMTVKTALLCAAHFFCSTTGLAIARAAAPQYIQVRNNLKATSGSMIDPTASAITLSFFNGSPYACFTAKLEYGESITLSSGARSPCVTPIQSMSALPLLSQLKANCYQPSSLAAVNQSYTNVTANVTSLSGPVFSMTTGVVVTAGTVQVVVTGS